MCSFYLSVFVQIHVQILQNSVSFITKINRLLQLPGKRRRFAQLFRYQVFYNIVVIDNFDFNIFQIDLSFGLFFFSFFFFWGGGGIFPRILKVISMK